MPKAATSSPNSLALGLDFGTTNTVVAMSTDATTAQVLPFTLEDETHPTFRSAMCFWEEDTDAAQDLRFEAGPWAIERFIDDPSDCRFLQSFKTFAASKSFTETHIHGKKFTFESLLTAFIERMRSHAGPALADLPLQLVAGRPVAFAGVNPNEALALERYEKAFKDVLGVDFPTLYSNWLDMSILSGDADYYLDVTPMGILESAKVPTNTPAPGLTPATLPIPTDNSEVVKGTIFGLAALGACCFLLIMIIYSFREEPVAGATPSGRATRIHGYGRYR